MRSFECLDKKIDSVLQEIIKESTDRINRLQLVASQNEVALEKNERENRRGTAQRARTSTKEKKR